MKKRKYVCTIESAGDGHMIIWLGKKRIEATCCLLMQEGSTRLTGTVRFGPTPWLHHEIEVTSADNVNGTIILVA